MCLIFVRQGYPRKLFNLEHFPIYGNRTVKVSFVHKMSKYVYYILQKVSPPCSDTRFHLLLDIKIS